jgi:hypothetical protein
MLVNSHVLITAGLFAVSEVLSLLPVKYHSVVHVSLDITKIIPDEIYERMEKNTLQTIDTKPFETKQTPDAETKTNESETV